MGIKEELTEKARELGAEVADMAKKKGNEIVAPHPAFRLFATANAVGAMSQFRHLYQGANLMNEAFLDRWRV